MNIVFTYFVCIGKSNMGWNRVNKTNQNILKYIYRVVQKETILIEDNTFVVTVLYGVQEAKSSSRENDRAEKTKRKSSYVNGVSHFTVSCCCCFFFVVCCDGPNSTAVVQKHYYL